MLVIKKICDYTYKKASPHKVRWLIWKSSLGLPLWP